MGVKNKGYEKSGQEMWLFYFFYFDFSFSLSIYCLCPLGIYLNYNCFCENRTKSDFQILCGCEICTLYVMECGHL